MRNSHINAPGVLPSHITRCSMCVHLTARSTARSTWVNTYRGNQTNMAKRKKADGESTSGYFRKLFESNLDWLSSSSNDVVKEKYKADFGKDMDQRVQGIMANVKSK